MTVSIILWVVVLALWAVVYFWHKSMDFTGDAEHWIIPVLCQVVLAVISIVCLVIGVVFVFVKK